MRKGERFRGVSKGFRTGGQKSSWRSTIMRAGLKFEGGAIVVQVSMVFRGTVVRK